MNYFSLVKKARGKIRLRHLDPNVATYLLQRRQKWDNTRLLMHYRDEVPLKILNQYQTDLEKYLQGMPPQYVIGTAPFYGYNFKVNRDVLIPRPETEELVDWLLSNRGNQRLNVADIGTGSGAIAIALKLQRPRWRVMATDLSKTALQVARKNADCHHADISFRQCDLFNGLPSHSFDVIISNPPYVAKKEIKDMDKSVLRFEPHLALFAKDDGLQIYERIACSFRNFLKPGGSLYLEIGFKQKQRILNLFSSAVNKSAIRIRDDIAHHPRMVRIVNPR